MRPILTSLLLFISPIILFAQTGSISGVIHDAGAKTEVPFANISLLNDGETSIVKGAISESNGSFKIDKIPYGSYKLVISFIGYVPDTLGGLFLNAKKPDINLGVRELHTSSIELSEITVQGAQVTSVTEIDRKKYEAREFETAKGGTAVDLLNKIPAISVDAEGNVSVRGASDFMVYLNGKPTMMEPSVLLAQLSADVIENIEVITVPSARYDSQGKGGIINIITNKKAKEGLTISANALAGGAPWGNLTDTYSGYKMNDRRYGGNLNLIYSKGKGSYFGSLYYNNKNINGDRSGDARILQDDDSYYHMVAQGERPEWFKNFSGNAGFEYKLSEKGTLSGAYYYGNRTEGRSAFYVYHNFYGDVDKNPIPGIPVDESWIYNPNTDTRYGTFQSGNVEYKTGIGENGSLTASLLYEHSELSRKLDNKNYGYDPITDEVNDLQEHFIQADDGPLDGWRMAIDYATILGNGHRLSVGVQPQIFRQTGVFTYDTLNANTGEWGAYSSLENAVDMKRGVYAGYIDYSGKTEKLEFSIGLRMEYTDQLMKIANPDYFSIFDRPTDSTYTVNQPDWFPSLHLKWSVTDRDNLILAASRRINRPPTKDMAPFLYRRHYEVYVVGDPALKPEYVNSAEFTYERELGNQNVSLTGFYRGTENAIFRVNTVYQEENVLIRSNTNSGNTTTLGGELNMNLAIGKKLTAFVGGSLYHFHVVGEVFGYEEDNQSTNWSLKANLNWQLIDALKLSSDFNYKSATATSQGANEAFYLLNAAVTYSPPKLKQWSFALRGFDLLGSNWEALYTRAYNSEGVQIFYQDVAYDRYGPIAEFGITYSFNSNGKSKKNPKSTFGDEQF